MDEVVRESCTRVLFVWFVVRGHFRDIFKSLSDVVGVPQIQDKTLCGTHVLDMDMKNLHKSRRT